MANWSQSHFLQSLGWATLNSFWQMALLWCLFLAATHTFRLDSRKRYGLAVTGILTGFGWFVLSFAGFYGAGPSASASPVSFIPASSALLQACLTAASVTYLALLAFPAYRLYRNWRFVQQIQHQGLRKADLHYRLFVQKIAGHLGIAAKVRIYVSELVSSPVTVGYLKPVILLPVAALNNLTLPQVEAVLLHELSHIRRYDYLVNFLVSIIHTFLYFNPFMRLFLRAIEAERENCCDELVLQFGYEKLSYASALLALEKISAQPGSLAIAATGKNYLLNRIEKIIGMEKKKKFQFRQLAGVLAALLCIVAFNSVLIIREEEALGRIKGDYAFSANPFVLFQEDESPALYRQENPRRSAINLAAGKPLQRTGTNDIPTMPASQVEEAPQVTGLALIPVAADAVDASLSSEQKAHVASTVQATKKVMTDLQWREIDQQLADVLTRQEKVIAHQEFSDEMEKINWQNLEQNLKARYEQLDWQRINMNLSTARAAITLDSLQQTYTEALGELTKAEADLARAKASCTPIPDGSVAELRKAKLELKSRVERLNTLRAVKKVVRL